MHFEPRLWIFTAGARLRILGAVLAGLVSVGLGVARLALLGWLIGLVFAGVGLHDLLWPVLGIAALMILRGGAEHLRVMTAHETAAWVQKKLRRAIYDKIAALGPGTVAKQRSGALTLSLIDGVEQLEVYFGQFLPQFLIALLTPVLIFAAIAWIDLPVAAMMLVFALIALFAPALWHRHDAANSMKRQDAYADFAAEFLDSVQGLATLKAFGQSKARADKLQVEAQNLYKRTLWVLATNSLSRGITDSAIACGAAAALALGAYRVEGGAMSLPALLVILMLGVEIYRPMRELRSVLHQGMVGMSAAQGIYKIFDAEPLVRDAAPATSSMGLAPSIGFEQVRFRYPGTKRIIHDGLDFDVAPGERIGLVGTSGGGKSSIVRLLLRFYDPEAGTIRLGGKDIRTLSFDQIRGMIAVVNQDTFLFHGTIEDNIRMGRPDASHEDVVAAARAANIDGFVASLPQGYRTVIGEKGIKLSGGQRQRVAIARAILRDAPILVLDEALSAVDAENEAVIQQALDRLMQGRTTLVLAHRLSSIIDCHRILVLDGGRVVESGRHETLLQAGGVYARLMAGQVRSGDAVAEAMPDEPTAPAGGESALLAGGIKQVTEGILKADGLNWWQLTGALMKLAMPWKGKLALTFIFGVLRVIAFIGIGVCSAFVVYDLKNGLDYASWLWALAVLAPLSGAVHWLESWVAHDMAFRLLAEMRIAVFRKLDDLAPAYLVRRRTGDLMALVTNDIELVEYFFAHTVAPAFVAILVPAVVLAVLAVASPWIALALVPFLLLVGLCPFLMRKRTDRLGSAAREAAGEFGAVAVDCVQGLGEIVTFQQEAAHGRKLDDLSDRHIALRLPFFRDLTLQSSLLEIFTGLGGLAVVVTGAIVSTQGGIDAAWLPLLTLLAMAAFLPVSEIAQVGRQLADTLGATRRIYGLLNEPVTVRDGQQTGQSMSSTGTGRKTAPTLSLEQVTFAYPGQARAALHEVSVTIPAGSTAALVGTSGAGKTTIAQLLMRFWDPDDGRITLDGADLRDYRLDDLRHRMALVAQDTYLFNDSLRHNIMIARPDASEAELQAAIAHASLTDLVQVLPDGLDTQVGERGTGLSGGQRQRVAIARAFLKDAPVLILDEATSHLDAVNEQAVRQALALLQTDRTTVIIAHRLSTVRDADLIIVLDGGRVAEIGTHIALMSKAGLYARLVARQLGAAYAPAAQ
ncbi:thiol reductant ABC exporter subunit CydC [Dongia soli]|uniref:Thiol reductant ABC exporter subunit CydC n=1 Tax=Dongia soli TaxID=600628 RepID=A0ABU5EBS4_9PROT|nr:thiol reductant ABC exporter subunit CydC [Dongia soli]MDY0883455.1 thiol reductant ABC exporter subunit CydC [Dongia soli]